jgi:hypothetical protein
MRCAGGNHPRRLSGPEIGPFEAQRCRKRRMIAHGFTELERRLIHRYFGGLAGSPNHFNRQHCSCDLLRQVGCPFGEPASSVHP